MKKVNATVDDFVKAFEAGGMQRYEEKPVTPSENLPPLAPFGNRSMQRGMIVYYRGAKCSVVDVLSRNSCDVRELSNGCEHWVVAVAKNLMVEV